MANFVLNMTKINVNFDKVQALQIYHENVLFIHQLTVLAGMTQLVSVFHPVSY